ncbi:MAG: hypothetical protein HKO03_01735 [Acidimicrobiia bacterium]|nr:hypothetical protein [Acidimicrobiia bacterium]
MPLDKQESKRVTDYLRAIRNANIGGMTDEMIEKKMRTTERALTRAQESGNLTNELIYTARLFNLSRMAGNGRIEELRQAFVAHGAEYARDKEIPYEVWRQFGVQPAVLRDAGIARSA